VPGAGDRPGGAAPRRSKGDGGDGIVTVLVVKHQKEDGDGNALPGVGDD
jgi:hypothetical protein